MVRMPEETRVDAYDPAAEAPHFRAFLDSITAGDQELQSFLQRFFGYALTGRTTEHVLLNCYGTGSNGTCHCSPGWGLWDCSLQCPGNGTRLSILTPIARNFSAPSRA